MQHHGVGRSPLVNTGEPCAPVWPDLRRARARVAAVLAPTGLRLSASKSRVCHIDEGFDFLGWRIQRRARRSRTGKKAI